MGSCIGKHSRIKRTEEEEEEKYRRVDIQIDLEAKIRSYQLLNSDLAVTRNRELIYTRMRVAELEIDIRLLKKELQSEYFENERLKNLFPVIV